jgi:hypothetical protein
MVKVGTKLVHITKYDGKVYAYAQLSYGEALPLDEAQDGTLSL